MSNTAGRFRPDPIPNIKSAGKVISVGNDSTQTAIKMNDNL